MGKSVMGAVFRFTSSTARWSWKFTGRVFPGRFHRPNVVAKAVRGLVDLDVTDERSLTAAVRDSVAAAVPVAR